MIRTILLVEDDANDVFFLKLAFQDAQVKESLQIVTDGQQAIAYLSGSGQFADRSVYPIPYLILLDLKLPYVMGLDVLKWVRQRPEFDASIVIVLTSSQDPRDLEQAYRLKTNGYLVKPSSLEKLHLLVQCVKEFWLGHNVPAPAFQK